MIDNEYERLVSEYTSDAGQEDTVFISITPQDQDFKALHMSFRKKNFDKTEFLNRVYKISQSNEHFLADETLNVVIQMVHRVSGAGRKTLRTLSDRKASMQSVICIRNNDNSCGYQAIAIGKFMADTENYNKHPAWRSLRRSSTVCSKRLELTRKFLQSIHWISEEPLNIDFIQSIQDRMPGYQIIVVDSVTKSRLFGGKGSGKTIFLLYTIEEGVGHYDVIESIAAFMRTTSFCHRCWLKIKTTHTCLDCCKQCGKEGFCEGNKEIVCLDCHNTFISQMCFDNHRQKRCEKRKKCPNCEVIVMPGLKNKHKCFEYLCMYCENTYTTSPHYCYVKALDAEVLKENDMKTKFFVAYDIESMQVADGKGLVHKPNLLIAMVCCDKCYSVEQCKKTLETCELCGPGLLTFRGEDCVKDFCSSLYKSLSPKAEQLKAKIIVFAHNNRGYDGHFIVKDYFQRNYEAKPEIILNGTKILKFEVENIRFIDSLSFFMQPLSSLPKSFGLEEEKGFFPHFFNTPENQTYIGALPAVEMYGYENMKPNMQKNFMKWYSEEVAKGEVFDFSKDIFRYCYSDVKILMGAMMKFRSQYRKITGLDPLTRRFTIASLGLEVFRAKVLRSSQCLAKTPVDDYGVKRGSVHASIWLDYIEKTTNAKLHREWRLGNLFADGYCVETKTAYEFLGCYYHGCTRCFGGDMPAVDDIALLQAKLEKKRALYRRWGLKLVELWEHDLISAVPSIYLNARKAHFKEVDEVGSACIREAFFGGRTNNIAFIHDCKEDERILYQDFTSLYPYVLKTKSYPVGHPTIINDEFDYTLNSYFGFVKCSVLPPGKLHIATLPYRSGKKLVFPLCRACVEQCNMNTCEHGKEERVLTNTWTTIELQHAIKDGYKIEKIYQVYNYTGEAVSSNLFSEYVKMWLKIKQEASGYPSWVHTEEDKEVYIKNYADREGINLEKEKIERNEGLRSIGKLFLNCLWGKFAQSNALKKTAFVYDYAELQGYLTSEFVSVEALHEIKPDLLMIQYLEQGNKNPGNTNIAVASFVTAYARIELLDLIRRVESVREGRTLYFDTDSVVYVSRNDDPVIDCGDFLGELTDELGYGKRCNRFVSLGPKNYAYQVVDEDTGEKKVQIKAKGISLTAKSLDIISIEKMVDLAKKYCEGITDEVFVPQTNITSDKKTHEVYTVSNDKVYRAVYTKRKIVDSITRPFGYIH